MLEIGEIFKNYNHICQRLGENPTTGGAKILQVEFWREHFKWEQIGYKFKITEIIKPMEKKISKVGRPPLWSKNFQLQVLNRLAQSTLISNADKLAYNEVIFTTVEGSVTFGLCNQDYARLGGKQLNHLELCMSKQEIKSISSVLWAKFNSIVCDSLHALDNKKIISYEYTYLVSDLPDSDLRLVTFQEGNLIKTRTLELLNSLEFMAATNEAHLFKLGLAEEFYKQRKELLKTDNLFNCSRVHRVGFTKSQIDNSGRYIKTLAELTDAKYDLNSKSYKFLSNKLLGQELIDYEENMHKVIEVLDIVIPIK